ncbi:hypothetical protein FA10DRAFT_303188 [Acaromyces ingoldii]|uniref:Uncharacterized protein n=1 Tax=Acaromyces ingoldii TaxID=215250 RepID=A0A316YGD8_9BASI|nr:hypothetical protein FA10DRAFT_303188 [Acaromyces ingoldii]PWN88201.1 hypothetical protein FA10DRAFT_303188 [Acaromyces ingoldii]
MDPWADDSSRGFGVDDSNVVKPRVDPPSPINVRPSALATADVDEDPWADTGASSRASKQPATRSEDAESGSFKPHSPSDSTSPPRLAREEEGEDSRPDPSRSLSSTSNSFDPWGGGASGFASGSGRDEAENGAGMHIVKEPEEAGTMVDPDDPWGSGAAARMAKIEREQEIRDIAQRLESVNRANQEETQDQEEAEEKGSEEQKDEAVMAPSTGWRSFFSKATKPSTTQQDPKKVDEGEADSKPVSERAETSATAVEVPSVKPAPKLWQAPSLKRNNLGSGSNHGRSTSSLTSPAGSTSSPTQGPGWEQTTSKKPAAGAQGGLFSGLFSGGGGGGGGIAGSSASQPSGGMGSIQAADTGDKPAGGLTAGLEARLGAIRQNLMPPPVVSAVDPEDQEYETEETGLEWDDTSSNLPNGKEQAETQQQPPSTVARLFGRWRKAETENTNKGEKSQQGMTADDLSWLESVETNQLEASKPSGMNAAEEEDWLKFVNDTAATTSSSSFRAGVGTKASTQQTMMPPPRLSGPPRAPANRQSLLDFDTFTQQQRQGSGLNRSQSVSSSSKQSSFVQQRPGASTGAPQWQQDRIASGGSVASAATPGSMDAFGDFERFESSPSVGQRGWSGPSDRTTAALDHSLLEGRPQPQNRTTSGIGIAFGRRPGDPPRRPKGKYDYDEDDAEEEGKSYGNTTSGQGIFGAYRDEDDRHYEDGYDEHTVFASSTKPPPLPQKTDIVEASSSRTTSPSLPPPPRASRPLSVQMNRNIGSVSSSNESKNSGSALPPPPGWRNAGPPPSAPSVPTSPPAQQAHKLSAKLSQGTGLTNDDLSFFENL